MIVENSDPVEVHASQPQLNTQGNFYRQYIGCQLSTISPIVTVQLTHHRPEDFFKQKSKLDLNWPSQPKIIPDSTTFYYITFSQPHIDIYNMLPEPKRYSVNLGNHIPIGVHAHSNVAHIALLGGDIVTFQLGSIEVERQHIGDLERAACIYSIQTVFGEERRQALRVVYEHQGMKFYQSDAPLFTFSITNKFKYNNFVRLISVPPYNLIGFVVTTENELKPINLSTKQLMDCDPIKLASNTNSQLLNLKFCTQVPNYLRKKGYVTFLMSLYETNGSVLKLYEVEIEQTMQSFEKILTISDIMVGNIGSVMNIKLLMIFNEEKLIQDVLMNHQGLFVSYRQHHNSPILKTVYKPYQNVIDVTHIQMLESEVFKFYKQDALFSDVDSLRQRILNPNLFTIPFLKANGLDPSQLHSKLMMASAQQLKNLFNRLITARWPQAYKFIGLVDVSGVQFVVRNNSVSILSKNYYGLAQFEQQYYEEEIKVFEKGTDKGSSDQAKPTSSVSRMSALNQRQQERKELLVPVQYNQLSSIKFKLERRFKFEYSDLSRQQYERQEDKQQLFYSKLMVALESIFKYISEYNQIQNTSPQTSCNSIIRNVTISQVRHSIKILSALLVKQYPKSISDSFENDKNLIMSFVVLNKIIHSPFALYQNYAGIANVTEYIHFDIVTFLVIKQTHIRKLFNFSSFVDHDYLKVISLLLKGDIQIEYKNNLDKEENTNHQTQERKMQQIQRKQDVNTNQIQENDQTSSRLLVQFNNSSQLIKLIVVQAELNFVLKKIASIYVDGGHSNITEFYLKACLIAENIEQFRAKVVFLLSTRYFSCKLLKSIFSGNGYSLYRRGRVVLEALSALFGEKQVYSQNINSYVSENYRDLITSLLGKCNMLQNTQNVKQRLSFLNNLSAAERLRQFAEKKKLQEIINEFLCDSDDTRMTIFRKELLKKHCQLANQLTKLPVTNTYLNFFLKQMLSNYRHGLKMFDNRKKRENVLDGNKNQNGNQISTEDEYTQNISAFIYGRLPSEDLLEIICKAHSESNKQVLLPYDQLPYEVLKSVEREDPSNISAYARKLLRYYPQSKIIKSLVELSKSDRYFAEPKGMSESQAKQFGYNNNIYKADRAQKILKIIQSEAQSFRKKIPEQGNY